MRAAFAVALSLPLVLTGCTLSPTTTETSPDPGVMIRGVVRGGQSPIVGARIYMFSAGTSGYGGASVSMLDNNGTATNVTLDSRGGATNGDYYVTSGANGAFSINGDYTCSSGNQVYLYAVGGDPGLSPPTTDNEAAGLLAVLGSCPNTGNFASATPFVVMNEVTTVAAAYAFAGFATDATHVSSQNDSLATTGVLNAFANAANLADISTGTALATPPSNSLGTAPQATVYTLANVLASCINTNGTITGGGSPTTCYTLLNNAKSAGSTGTVPSDTATAAINIAHNPGANITTLYGLAAGESAPFGSALTSQPNDFTLSLQLTTEDMSGPHALAVDGSGNVWVANSEISSIDEFTSAGLIKSGTNGFTGGGLFNPDGIAIDLSGYVWATNYTFGNVSKFTSSGSPVTGSPFSVGGASYGPYGIAIDGSGNVWVSNNLGNSVSVLNSGGTLSAFYNAASVSGLNLGSPRGIAIDASGNAWIANTGTSTVAELSNTGGLLSGGTGAGGINRPYSVAIDSEGDAWIPNYGTSTNTSTVTELTSSLSLATGTPFSEGGAYEPEAVAIDGAGNAWIADSHNASVSEFSSSGTLVSPSTGYTASGNISQAVAIAVDGSGNVWVANSDSGTVTELVGAGTPVVTPLVVGIQNKTLGTRP